MLHFRGDVEQGLPEEEVELKPLLKRDGRLPLPSWPSKIGLLDLRDPRFQNLSSLIVAPPASPSTVKNPRVAEGAKIFLRKWWKSDRRKMRLNTELLTAIEKNKAEDVESLLKAGANPNATCRRGMVTACHIAAHVGGDALSLLVKAGAEKNRQDRLGRTPLHLAAHAGNTRQLAILLDIPEELHDRIDSAIMSSDSDVEENVKKLREQTKLLANVRVGYHDPKEATLSNTWKDDIGHNCRITKRSLPSLPRSWTPLHAAASCARKHCTRLLLAAGADPNLASESGWDSTGRLPLDVAGSAYWDNIPIDSADFTEVLRLIIRAGGENFTMHKTKHFRLYNITTPLHVAVELENLDAIKELLEAGVSIACFNSEGQTPLHVCVEKELEDPLKILVSEGCNDSDLSTLVDVKDHKGHTVLQAAIMVAWVRGVCVALDAGADVTLKDYDGETPIHSAAALGNLDVLSEILSVVKQKDTLDYQNKKGETALFKAIKHGHLACVQLILEEGASIEITKLGDVNVFHVAAKYGKKDVLDFLLDYDEEVTESMINNLTEDEGYGPLHFAVAGNHHECVDLLLKKNANIRRKTTYVPHLKSTPLHIAAVKNSHDAAAVLLRHDVTIMNEVNTKGWYPIHSASHHGSRDVIVLLIREGASLALYTDTDAICHYENYPYNESKKTALDMIMNNMSKPTEFLEEVLDSYISMNDTNGQNAKTEVTIDCRVLMPSESEPMKVIEALLKTGNRYRQKRLLFHPLIESFLYIAWKTHLPFFYTIIVFNAAFLMSLTIYAVSVFYYRDNMQEKPAWLNDTLWGSVVCGSNFFKILQELHFMNVKRRTYFLQVKTWVKLGTIVLAFILPPAVSTPALADAEWPRHVATVAVLLAGWDMMFLLARFPKWGYYVLMFGKVASKVIKILLTFVFLVIGFSFGLMIQFRSKTPFEGPWAAFVKTLVMMTSEFDYSDLFDEDHSKELAYSFHIVRLLFVAFVILVAIVLMNLMVGVAVSDINDLETLGKMRRLKKQADFLSTLDTVLNNGLYYKIKLILWRVKIPIIKKINREIKVTAPWRHDSPLPLRLWYDIFDKAQNQKKQKEDEIDFIAFKGLLQEMRTVVAKKDSVDEAEVEKSIDNRRMRNLKRENEMDRLDSVDGEVPVVKDQIDNSTKPSKSPIEALNEKVDQISMEIEEINKFLVRLESKLSKL